MLYNKWDDFVAAAIGFFGGMDITTLGGNYGMFTNAWYYFQNATVSNYPGSSFINLGVFEGKGTGSNKQYFQAEIVYNDHTCDCTTNTVSTDDCIPDPVNGTMPLATCTSSCGVVDGCTDNSTVDGCGYGCNGALNFNRLATNDDGSCIYCIWGCTDTLATNYNGGATCDDGSCTYRSVDFWHCSCP